MNLRLFHVVNTTLNKQVPVNELSLILGLSQAEPKKIETKAKAQPLNWIVSRLRARPRRDH